MLTGPAAALAGAVTDGADPTTWVQALGGGSILALSVGLAVFLIRMYSRSGSDARQDNDRLDKQIAERDRTIERERKEHAEQLAAARKELDAERAARFKAENDKHTCELELTRLQQIMTRMAEQRAEGQHDEHP